MVSPSDATESPAAVGPPGVELERDHGLHLSRRQWRWIATIFGAATVAITIGGGSLWSLRALSWANTEPLGNPAIGINFSCNYAEYLLVETGDEEVPDNRPDRARWCAATLAQILERTGAKYVRLSVEWSQVEPQPGAYDFALIDALLQATSAAGAKALVTVGLKAQRHPEYYVPDWLLEMQDLAGYDGAITDEPWVRNRAHIMVLAVVGHLAGNDAIDSWGADNEPYLTSARGAEWANWVVGRDFIQWIIATIHELDPQDRPVIVNHGQIHATDRLWRDALADADILGVSLYPFRNAKFLGHTTVADIVQLGPFFTNYAHQAREAREAGKEYWMTELQGEPWFETDARLVSPEQPSPNLSPEKFASNIEYGRRSGASRVYLWGAEWWLLQEQRYGDARWMDVAAQAIAASEHPE